MLTSYCILSIVLDRYVTVSFNQSEYNVRESDGRVAVTIVAYRHYFYGSFPVKIRTRVNTHLRPYGTVL